MKWRTALCLAIALGPVAAPFVLWPVMALAGCERAGVDTLKCVHAEWLSGFATAVVHLPWLVFVSVPAGLVAFLILPPLASARQRVELSSLLPGLAKRLLAVAVVAIIVVVTVLSLAYMR